MKKTLFAIGAICMFLVLGLSSVACAEGTTYRHEYSGLVMETIIYGEEDYIESTALLVNYKKINKDTGEVVETKLLPRGEKFVCDTPVRLPPTFLFRILLHEQLVRILHPFEVWMGKDIFDVVDKMSIMRPHMILLGVRETTE